MKSKAVNVFWITKYRLNVMQHLLFDIDQYKFVFMSTFSNHPSVRLTISLGQI